MASLTRQNKPPQKCPFCFPFTKRTFDDIGLLQHCIAISRFNGNLEVVRAHSVILNDLNRKLDNITTTRNGPLLPRGKNVNSQPQTNAIPMPLNVDLQGLAGQDNEVKTVWPWMGILMNIKYEQIAKKCGTGKPITDAHWNVDLKSYFAYLNPSGVQAFWTQGVAVLDFGRDLLGFFDAQDFDKGFAHSKRGKFEFERRIKQRKEQVQEMFGWLADENDYNQMSPVGEYLRKRGALRVKPRFRQAWTEQHGILLQDVQLKLQEKNMKLMVLGKEVCSLRTSAYQEENKKYSAEAQLLLIESKHKQELDAITERTNKVIETHNDELVKEREKNKSLEVELRNLQAKCQNVEENSTQSTSDETLIPKLIELVEEKEVLQDYVEKLIYKERDINDKFQSAMEAAKEVLQENIEENTGAIGIKKVGEVKDGPWKKAFAKKFKGLKGDWETSCAEMITQWSDIYIKDPSWYPYKVVETKGGKFEYHIDTNDERLAKLNEDFGEEVWKTVVDALNELNEFNASGRYPISVPWNFDQGRAARLDEIIKHLASDRSKKRKLSLG